MVFNYGLIRIIALHAINGITIHERALSKQTKIKERVSNM